MAEYELLKSLVGQVKRAAIDAYMCGDTPGGGDGIGILGWVVQGDQYFCSHPAGQWGATTEEVSRPDENGEGGGTWKMRIPMAFDPDSEPKYVDEFNTIRTTIDEIFDPWLEPEIPDPDDFDEIFDPWLEPEIPDPDDFDEMIGYLDAAIGDLTLSEDETYFSAGEIRDLVLTQLKRIENDQYGPTVRAFENNYGRVRCETVTQNQRALLIRLGQALCAEQEIWYQARPTIATLADDARKAFDEVATEGSAANYDVVLKIVSGVIGIVADFAPGGKTVQKSIMAAGKAMDLLTQFENPSPPQEQDASPLSGGSYSDVCEKLQEAVRDLNLEIIDSEYYIWQTLQSTTAFASQDDQLDNFHIHHGRGVATHDDQTGVDWNVPNGFSVDPDVFEEIGRHTLPSLGAIVTAAADQAALSKKSVWTRNGRIGWQTEGPKQGYNASLDWVCQMMRSTGRDLVAAGEQCRDAAGTYRDTDAATDAAFKKQYRKLDVGILETGGTEQTPPDPDAGSKAGPDDPYNPYDVKPTEHQGHRPTEG